MWWELRELSEPALRARLGQLVLWVRAEPGELVVHQRREPGLDDGIQFDSQEPPDESESCRFVLGSTPTAIALVPRLVARSVVVRPQIPVFLPPHEKVAIFVTSPLCVSLQIGNVELTEIPISEPAETWFGPSPVRGELCYAARTRGTRKLADLAVPPTRVVTQVLLENEGESTLEAKSIRLPMTRLSLAWDSERKQLVTETVRLRRDDANQAELSIEDLPGGVSIVAPPRDPSRAVWKHALAALWS